MRIKVVGITKIDYTNKAGRHVCGVNLHGLYEDNKTVGFATDKFYLSADFPNLDKVKINNNVDIYFNQYGKVDFLAVAE